MQKLHRSKFETPDTLPDALHRIAPESFLIRRRSFNGLATCGSTLKTQLFASNASVSPFAPWRRTASHFIADVRGKPVGIAGPPADFGSRNTNRG
jgi:hypothetical protein